MLRRLDAPRLFDDVEDVARRLGVRPPEEIRLAFLPCCGVVAWRRSRALLLGMPLLHVLTISELRAVLAHELAHLARGDATWSAGSLRFVEALSRALDDPSREAWGPLGLWARVCRRAATAAHRADFPRAGSEGRPGLGVASGRAAWRPRPSSRSRLVQPLFRELLGHHEADRPDGSNLYSTFRAFWARLPGPLMEAMRLRLLAVDPGSDDSPHPPLPDRIAMVQSYPDLAEGPRLDRRRMDHDRRPGVVRTDARRPALRARRRRAHRLPQGGDLTSNELAETSCRGLALTAPRSDRDT